MTSTNCNSCGVPTDFGDTLPRRGPICFRCHIGSVRLGFSAGKEDFHGPTIKQRQDQIEHRARIQGRQIERVGERWV